MVTVEELVQVSPSPIGSGQCQRHFPPTFHASGRANDAQEVRKILEATEDLEQMTVRKVPLRRSVDSGRAYGGGCGPGCGMWCGWCCGWLYSASMPRASVDAQTRQVMQKLVETFDASVDEHKQAVKVRRRHGRYQ